MMKKENKIYFCLIIYVILVLVQSDHAPAKFSIGSMLDTESRWAPPPGKEFLYFVRISCAEYLDTMPFETTWRSTVFPKIIEIQNCTLPTTPLAEAFTSLDIDISHIDKLILTDCAAPSVTPENYTAGINSKVLVLSNVLNVTMKFFQGMNKLYKLTVENMPLPPLIPAPKPLPYYNRDSGLLIILALKNSTMKNVVNCEYVEDLTIQSMEADQISEWPEGCGGLLRTLRLDSLSPEAVQKVMTLRPYFFIRFLSLTNSPVNFLPLMLMRGLQGTGMRFNHLNLKNNTLEDSAFSQFPALSDLSFLDLSYNRLNGERLKKLLPNSGFGVGGLETLNLDGNNFKSNIFDKETKSLLASKKYLTHLHLNGMNLEPDCLRRTHFRWLVSLGLNSSSSRIIENLQLHDLPSTGASELTVDLRGRSVRSIRIGPNFTEDFENINRSEHWLTNKGYKLIVLLDSIDCECNNDVLQRALTIFPEQLSMPGLKCNNGRLFLQEPFMNLNCRKATVNGCKRKLSREENYTSLVDCSYLGSKFRWPRPQRLQGLNAAGNGISSLKSAYLPDTIQWLDLSNNNLTRLTQEEINLIFGPQSRTLKLAGNPFSCECENSALISALHTNSKRVLDFDHIRCSEGLVSEITIFDICTWTRKATIPRMGMGYRQRHANLIEKDIICSGALDDEPPIQTIFVIHKLSLYDCILSSRPLREVFDTINMNSTNLDTLTLKNINMPTSVPANYSNGLQMNNLHLENISKFPKAFFTALTNPVGLTIVNMDVPYIPTTFPLRTLTVRNSTLRSWDNCLHLQNLKVYNLQEEQMPESWPDNCEEMRELTLQDSAPGVVKRVMDNINGTYLLNLRVYNCSLIDVPLHQKRYSSLRSLDLAHNNLEDQALSQFPELPELENLDLSNNKLTGEFLIKVIPNVPQMRNLILDNNHFTHIFQNVEIKTGILNLRWLYILSLNDMNLSADCFMNRRFHSLQVLRLRSNLSREQQMQDKYNRNLKLYGLPGTNAENLEVDLRGRSFRSVIIDKVFKEDLENTVPGSFWMTNKGYKLEVKMDSIDCNCNNDLLSVALRDFSQFLSMPDLRCDTEKGRLFVEEPLRNLKCMKAIVHGCRRKISRLYDYETVVDCSHSREKVYWPRPDKYYRGLNMSGNNITSLRNAYLPDSLEWVDLSNNLISHLYGNEPALLFGTPSRRVRLSGNPIACHCNNRLLLDALRINHTQVIDYDELTCAETGLLLRLASIDELCRFKVEYVWGTGIVVAVVGLIAALFLRHYWLSIRTYLYARGYCLSCLDDEDDDEDRPFDVFVSFAHQDGEYVGQKLVPLLEGEPNFYRVCVHHRDWTFGEWIPAQIMQSVRLSKRTIIVLSKHFVRSLWGSMEFRYALATSEAEGRSRLLVLILDDVLEEHLAPELKNYLDMNTYLRCDDDWFLDKLRYAMPHVQRSPTPQDRVDEGISNTNYQHSEPLPMEEIRTENPTNVHTC